MKIVVIGATGLIGSKTVAILREEGHEVVAGSPKSGVNTITGKGLKEAMAGAQVAIDLANSPSFEDKAVLEFFETSGRNLLAAEAAAGVRHHVALSIVGTDRSDNGYFRAKVAQEKLIKTSGKGGRGVYVRAQRDLLPPRASDMLPVRNRAIDGIGLSPTRFAALPAATRTFGLQTLRV